MAVTKLSNSGIKTGVLKYDSMLAGNAAYDPAATWLIQRQTATGSEASITFSSIPQTYQHLQIRAMTRETRAVTVSSYYVRFNSDTGANYVWHSLYGNGTTVTATAGTSQTSIEGGYDFGSSATANLFGVSIIDIHDYASTTKNKTVRMIDGRDNNSTNGLIKLASGLWLSTSAITSITVTPTVSGNFAASTTFALYGFKG